MIKKVRHLAAGKRQIERLLHLGQERLGHEDAPNRRALLPSLLRHVAHHVFQEELVHVAARLHVRAEDEVSFSIPDVVEHGPEPPGVVPEQGLRIEPEAGELARSIEPVGVGRHRGDPHGSHRGRLGGVVNEPGYSNASPVTCGGR
jgi:hypothetical protein